MKIKLDTKKSTLQWLKKVLLQLKLLNLVE